MKPALTVLQDMVCCRQLMPWAAASSPHRLLHPHRLMLLMLTAMAGLWMKATVMIQIPMSTQATRTQRVNGAETVLTMTATE